MALQLDDVFSGVRMRRRKKQHNALVDRLASGVAKCRKHGVSRFKRACSEGRGKPGQVAPGDADYADAAATGGGRDRGNDVALDHARRV